MGETFGYCAKITQNDGINGDYVVPTISASGIHVSLMGDPTLRMQYLSGPPSALSASIIGGSSVKLSWTAPTVAVPGYNIYRAKSSTDSMMKINPSPVTSISFTDNTPLNDTNVYVVRAVASTTTPSGSFWNESGGASVTVDVKLAGVLAQLNQNSGLRITSNEQSVEISFDGQREQPVQLSVIDITGREVLILSNGTLPPGVYNYHLNKSEFATGAYFIRMLSSDGVRDAKFLVTR
jgi:hypothetical protein